MLNYLRKWDIVEIQACTTVTGNRFEYTLILNVPRVRGSLGITEKCVWRVFVRHLKGFKLHLLLTQVLGTSTTLLLLSFDYPSQSTKLISESWMCSSSDFIVFKIVNSRVTWQWKKGRKGWWTKLLPRVHMRSLTLGRTNTQDWCADSGLWKE